MKSCRHKQTWTLGFEYFFSEELIQNIYVRYHVIFLTNLVCRAKPTMNCTVCVTKAWYIVLLCAIDLCCCPMKSIAAKCNVNEPHCCTGWHDPSPRKVWSWQFVYKPSHFHPHWYVNSFWTAMEVCTDECDKLIASLALHMSIHDKP